ncbi:J domain-containing protein [Vibrio splendidus]|uniref:J domain-containing protein n=1 Tax=Vibrio splendidus TaxID=29497 RepID=UPI003D0FC298
MINTITALLMPLASIVIAGGLATYYIFNSVIYAGIAGVLFFIGYMVINKSTSKRSDRFNEARDKIRAAGYDSTIEPTQRHTNPNTTSSTKPVSESIYPSDVDNALKALNLPCNTQFTARDIKKAYHTHARLYHPDLVKGSTEANSTDKIVLLNKSKSICLKYLQG